MIQIISGILGFLGNAVGGFFGMKEKQAETIGKAIQTLERIDISAESREKAIASVIAAEATSGYWLAAVWRPLLMCVFAGIIIAYVFGWTTPSLMVPLPQGSFLSELFEILKVAIMGYIPARTVEKIASQINIGKIIEKMLKKQVD